ncbi:MAG: L-seryl-tRNA(Sec) selenium transferase [Oscillospiraceae bacterium]|nr:L-seryl-tRNA(Sec) selenium transferase [Oscillospiraceae bacterium]
MANELLRKLPKVDVILARESMIQADERHPHAIVKAAVKHYIDELRADILAGKIDVLPSIEEMEKTIIFRIDDGQNFHLKRLINATGVVLHTNMGRAPLGDEIAAHVAEVSKGYSNLEYDTEKGKRGSRYSHIESLLCEITGAEAAMVVNNNASAVFLMLNTLAKGKKVAISRGEAVEIGGAFRIPEIMKASGAELCEVGCTNKTHGRDYIKAMDEDGVEVILKAYTSNYVVSGFSQSVGCKEMADIAHERGGIAIYDQGSAFMFLPEELGLHVGVCVNNAIKEGMDVVSFSGDKLIGGAQGGFIIGKKKYIEAIKKNQLTRMMRIDKMSLASFEIILQYCRDAKLAMEKIPTLHMLTLKAEECLARAERLEKIVNEKAPECPTKIVAVKDEAGAGSLAGVEFDGWALAVKVPGLSEVKAEDMLHKRGVPIVCRVNKDGLIFSTRTIFDQNYEEIAQAIADLYDYSKRNGLC